MRRKRLSNFFYVGNNYKSEVRKQIRMFIVFTLAFTIAFAWRESVFRVAVRIIQITTGLEGTARIGVLASVLITIVAVLLIFLTSYYFKKRY